MIINYKEKQITKKTKSNAESKKRISWIIIPTNCFCVRLAKKTLTSLSEKELLIKLEEYIKFINLPKEFKSYINESEIKVRERERYKMLLKLYNIKKEDEKGTYYEKLREKNPFIAFWLDAVDYLGRKKTSMNKIYLPKIPKIETLIERQKRKALGAMSQKNYNE